jgi:hypothetical protein
MLGYEAIPDVWKSGIPALADTKFDYTNYSLNGITASTLARALRIVERAGGTVTADEVVVPYQAPVPAALEQWEVDPPTARLDSSSAAWRWSEGWRDEPSRNGRVKMSTAAKAEVTLTFRGTGIIIVGRYLEDGGGADVFLDGQPAGTIEARQVPRTHDNVYWHYTGLASAPHTVRIRMRADAGEAPIAIERAVILGN